MRRDRQSDLNVQQRASDAEVVRHASRLICFPDLPCFRRMSQCSGASFALLHLQLRYDPHDVSARLPAPEQVSRAETDDIRMILRPNIVSGDPETFVQELADALR